MNNGFGKALAITRINLKQLKFTYIFTAAALLLGIASVIVNSIILDHESDGNPLNPGCYLYFIIIFAPIFIPAKHFPRIMHLNARKTDYYWGALLNYVLLSAAVSALSLLSIYIMGFTGIATISMIQAFGWLNNGPVIAFFQQFAFLLFVSVFIHTLTSAQSFWAGWVADILLVAIISVFLPIEPLRLALGWFFYMIIFQESVLLQISACLILAAAIYALSMIILRRKKI